MEQHYHWPVAHREGLPDLSNGEAAYYTGVQEFNAHLRNIKVVFINQFGWEQKLCGNRMPADMEFMDIRKGSDVEFGQSIYEPFGIAQVEPISFGGICVFSECLRLRGFVESGRRRQAEPELHRRRLHRTFGVVIAPRQLLTIGQPQRDPVENTVARRWRPSYSNGSRARPQSSRRPSNAATPLRQR